MQKSRNSGEGRGDRFRELQSGGPVTLLESSKLYRVHESFLGKLNELKKAHPEVSAVNLADILNARPFKSGFKKDELGSKRPDVQIRALLALEKGLAGGTVELSEDDKATAAKRTFSLNSGLSRIYRGC